MTDGILHRFTFFERVLHWVVGVGFVILLATGLAFAYPSLFWITTLVGGGPAARVLHPWVGAVFSAGMFVMVAIWIRDMFLSETDWRWLGAVRYHASRQRDKVPPAGKYNAGHETEEVKLVSIDEIPWDDIAFSAVKFSLTKYVERLKSGATSTYCGGYEKDDSDPSRF